MITYSGVHIQKIGGVEGVPTPLDIAVHSGRICRYGGAIWYPLLPHLVFVGLMAYRRSGIVQDLLWGFLHDAHECVTSDVPRPFKCDCMREEQKALDLRLFTEYEGIIGNISNIDFDLIKECDKHALHIEAVELGLPGFSEVELKYATDYLGEKEIYSGREDVELFRAILQSPFFGDTHYDGCRGVSMFSHALQKALDGDTQEFLYNVESWELLKAVAK